MRNILATCSAIALCVAGLSAQDVPTVSMERLLQGAAMLDLLKPPPPERPVIVLDALWPLGHRMASWTCSQVCGPVGPLGREHGAVHHTVWGHLGLGDVLFSTGPLRPALHSEITTPD